MTDSRYCVIVAHPDDEILFFSSLLQNAAKIITCFGPCADPRVSAGRAALRKTPPLPQVIYLNCREANVCDQANWRNPDPTAFGLAVRRQEKAYQDNFATLYRLLDQLIDDGMRLYTHNPWGEYGHEEHVQVFRLVEKIARHRQLDLFVDGFVSDNSFPLSTREAARLGERLEVGHPPHALCQQMMEIYQAQGCWTWRDDYRWPLVEVFFHLPADPPADPPARQSSARAYPPLQRFSHSFRRPFYVKWAHRLLPERIKKALRQKLRGKRREP
jgi:LmbE family N-acetylglucosaminyl deacetylase